MTTLFGLVFFTPQIHAELNPANRCTTQTAFHEITVPFTFRGARPKNVFHTSRSRFACSQKWKMEPGKPNLIMCLTLALI